MIHTEQDAEMQVMALVALYPNKMMIHIKQDAHNSSRSLGYE